MPNRVSRSEQKEYSDVTIFMPTFNSQSYLVEAIESIRGQTYQKFNLLIIDGGSSDHTNRICELFASEDPRITFITSKEPPYSRLNEVLHNTQSKYLFLAHSDDIQSPYRLQLQIATFESDPDLMMCGGRVVFWHHNFRASMDLSYSGLHHYPNSHEEIMAKLPFWWCFSNPSLAFNVKKFQSLNIKHPTVFSVSGDYLFYWSVAKAGKVGNLDQILLAYRVHASSDGVANYNHAWGELREVRRIILSLSGLRDQLDDRQVNILLDLKIETSDRITNCPASMREYKKLFRNIERFYKTKNIDCYFLEKYLKQIRWRKRSEFVKSIVRYLKIDIPQNIKKYLKYFYKTINT